MDIMYEVCSSFTDEIEGVVGTYEEAIALAKKLSTDYPNTRFVINKVMRDYGIAAFNNGRKVDL